MWSCDGIAASLARCRGSAQCIAPTALWIWRCPIEWEGLAFDGVSLARPAGAGNGRADPCCGQDNRQWTGDRHHKQIWSHHRKTRKLSL